MEKTVNDRVIDLLKNLQIDEQELASMIGKSPSTIYRIINKEVVPSKTTIKLIADATGTNFNHLLKGIKSDAGEFKSNAEAKAPWKDEAYASLKENNSYLQRKYDEAMSMLSKLIDRGNLGKYKSFGLSGLPNGSRPKVKVN